MPTQSASWDQASAQLAAQLVPLTANADPVVVMTALQDVIIDAIRRGLKTRGLGQANSLILGTVEPLVALLDYLNSGGSFDAPAVRSLGPANG